MQAVSGGGKLSPNRLQRQRNGLLAKVHIAKKDLGLSDDLYRAVLERFGVSSAAALSILELEELVRHFKGMGFKKQGSGVRDRGSAGQVEALQGKILERAFVIERGEQRMLGLVKAKCGVDRLEWCRDVGKLKQVLKVLNLLG